MKKKLSKEELEQLSDIDAFLNSITTEAEPKKKSKPAGKKTGKKEKVKKSEDDVAVEDMQEMSEVIGDVEGTKAGKKKPTKKKDDEMSPTAMLMLSKNARKVLKNFNLKFQKANSTQQKYAVLRAKVDEYRIIGDEEAVQACLAEMEVLKNMVVKSKEIRQNSDEKVRNSPEMKEINERLKELKDERDSLRPNWYIKQLYFYRSHLDKNDVDCEIIDLDDDTIEDVADIVENNLPTNAEYRDLLRKISNLTGIEVKELDMMNTNQVRIAITEALEESKSRIEEIDKEIIECYGEREVLKNKLRGYNDVVDAMYDIFDYSEIEEPKNAIQKEEIKNILAASMIPFVQALAYKTCLKLNALEYMPDVVGYGLVTLSEEINKWLNIQKTKDLAISFSTFAVPSITGEMKKKLSEMLYSGTIGGSSVVDNIHKMNKAKALLISKIRVELGAAGKDLTDEFLYDAYIAGTEDESKIKERYSNPGEINTESEISSTIGGDQDGDGVDAWNFIASRDADENTYAESKLVYGDLIEGIRELFNMFELKTKDSGQTFKENRNKKMFTTQEFLLFKMYFGFDKVQDPETGKWRPYNQEEMAERLWRYEVQMKLKPADSKPITQSAMSTKKDQLLKKIKYVISYNENIKKSFEYILYYIQANPNAFAVLSTGNITLENKTKVLDAFDEARQNINKVQELFDMDDNGIEGIGTIVDMDDIAASISEIHDFTQILKTRKS